MQFTKFTSVEGLFAQRSVQENLLMEDYMHRRFDQPKACAIEICGKTDKVFKCGRCQRRYYCSKEHQVADWKEHKKHCKVFVDVPILPEDQRTHEPISEAERWQKALEYAEEFIQAFRVDSFCTNADTDGVFGWIFQEQGPNTIIVDGNFPIGQLMRSAWNYIIKRSDYDLDEWKNMIVNALIKGEMVTFFKEKSYELKDTCSYNRELYMREYKGIIWNQRAHLMLAGERY